MATLTQASRQWASRPDDQRFTSLVEMLSYKDYLKSRSKRSALANRDIEVRPIGGTDRWDVEAIVKGREDKPVQISHWAFGQMASLASVPASYLRDGLPAQLVSANLDWGLHHRRPVEDLSVYFQSYPEDCGFHEPGLFMAAANGPKYGMLWDADVLHEVHDNFGDGRTGAWTVPGEFGKAVEVTKANTTLYASDHDMWLFLADETRRLTVHNRRDGNPGSLARGFYISNSEVGASRFVLGMFLFDYVCQNRMIWGAEQFREISFKHTSGAPHRWVEEVQPILREFAEASPKGIEETIAAAQSRKLDSDLDAFLTKHFGSDNMTSKIKLAFAADEGLRPMETLWDVVTGATAYARSLQYADARVGIERTAGRLLAMAA